MLTTMGCGLAQQIYVISAIRVTTHKDEDRFLPECPDAAYLADADLKQLAAPWEEFDDNSRRVREEYGHVPDLEFAQGRLRIMKGLLVRAENGVLFQTKEFRSQCNSAAIANLNRHCHDLLKQTVGVT
jgi:predicted metal-dependent HD superfamily phosphohydrolase